MGALDGIFSFPARQRLAAVGHVVVGALAVFSNAAGKIAASLVTVDDSGNVTTPGMIDGAASADGASRLWCTGTGAFHRAKFGNSASTFPAVTQSTSGNVVVGDDDGGGAHPPSVTVNADTSVTVSSPLIQLGALSDVRLNGSVTVSGTGGAADASASLDVRGYDGAGVYRGFLPPRHTAVTRALIAAPATSLIIYNTDAARLEMWDGAAWVGISTVP